MLFEIGQQRFDSCLTDGIALLAIDAQDLLIGADATGFCRSAAARFDNQ